MAAAYASSIVLVVGLGLFLTLPVQVSITGTVSNIPESRIPHVLRVEKEVIVDTTPYTSVLYEQEGFASGADVNPV